MNPLKCDEVKNSLVEYLEFELPLPRREQFYEHLMACDKCRAIHDNMQGVLMKIKHDDIDQPTQDYWDSLADNVLEEVKQKRSEMSSKATHLNIEIGHGDYGNHDDFQYDTSNVIAFKSAQAQSVQNEIILSHDDVHGGDREQPKTDDSEQRDRQPVQEYVKDEAVNRAYQRENIVKPLVRRWPRLVLPVAAAVLIGMAAVFSLLDNPIPDKAADEVGFQAKIRSEQPLAYLAKQIAPLSQHGNRFGFNSQIALFNSFSIGSLFSEARALATVDNVAPLKTQLALLRTALIREDKPQQTTIDALENLQKQLNGQNNAKGVEYKLVSLFNDYVRIAGDDDQVNKDLASAGAWLFDYALAALAHDTLHLKQVQQLHDLNESLQKIGVPPGVGKSFNRMLDIARKETFTQQDFNLIVREVENIRSLLG